MPLTVSTDSPSKSRAPLAPNKVPYASTEKKPGSTTSASAESSTLRLLEKELGRDADLLNHIPLATVKMVQDTQLGHCLPHKIFIGTVKAEGQVCDAWAFISAKKYSERECMPRMLIFAGPQSSPLKKYHSDQMDDDGTGCWTEVFRKLSDPVRRSTCFILKGAQFPADVQFTTRFLKELKVLCRSFTTGDTKHHSTEITAAATPTSTLFYEKPMMARKSQQQGPSEQLFNLPVASGPRDREEISKTSEPTCTQTTDAQAHIRRKNNALQDANTGNLRTVFESSDAHITTGEVRAPKQTVFKKAASTNAAPSSVEAARQKSEPYLSTASSTNITKHSNHQAFITTPQAKVEPELSSKPGKKSLTPSLPVTNGMAPGKEERDCPRSMKRGLDDHHALQERMIDLEEKLSGIDAAEKEMDKTYNDMRSAKKHGIDVEMKERHNAEIKALNEELLQRHKAEVAAAKSEYAVLKTKHYGKIEMLHGQRTKVVEQKRLVEEDIERIQNEWTPEQMRKLLTECAREQAQKRRKTWQAGDEEGEK